MKDDKRDTARKSLGDGIYERSGKFYFKLGRSWVMAHHESGHPAENKTEALRLKNDAQEMAAARKRQAEADERRAAADERRAATDEQPAPSAAWSHLRRSRRTAGQDSRPSARRSRRKPGAGGGRSSTCSRTPARRGRAWRGGRGST